MPVNLPFTVTLVSGKAWARSAALRAIFSLSIILSLGARAILAADLVTSPREDRFQAGEALLIDVTLDTAGFINGGYAIDSAGYADLPVVGRVNVHGKSPEDVESFLSAKLSNYLRDININVTPCIRLTLLGNFRNQGQHYVSPGATVWEAILQAGGMADERKLDELHVLRGKGRMDIDVLGEYSRGKTLAAAGIRSGDIIVLPVSRPDEGFWFYFRETLSATAQVATIASTVLTVYITYQLLDLQRDQN